MKRILLWAGAVAALSLLVWLFRENQQEKTKEHERERPVSAATRLIRDSSGVTLVLDPEMQERIGITTEEARSESAPEEVLAYGQVLDPGPLVSEAGELAAAEAASRASHAEAERLRTLFRDEQNASRKSVDAAEAQERADHARAEAARAHALSSWGELLGTLTEKARSELAEALASRRAALARVGLPVGTSLRAPPISASVTLLGREDESFPVERIFAARSVDPQTQGTAFILSFVGRAGSLPAGAAITARLSLPGPGTRSVVVSRSAIVRHAGATWVFIRVGPARFAQRLVSLVRPSGDGWAVSGLRNRERVVTRGAQLLLSEVLKSQFTVGDEGEATRDEKEKR